MSYSTWYSTLCLIPVISHTRMIYLTYHILPSTVAQYPYRNGTATPCVSCMVHAIAMPPVVMIVHTGFSIALTNLLTIVHTQTSQIIDQVCITYTQAYHTVPNHIWLVRTPTKATSYIIPYLVTIGTYTLMMELVLGLKELPYYNITHAYMQLYHSKQHARMYQSIYYVWQTCTLI